MKNEIDTARMSRPVHDVPEVVVAALVDSKLREAYKARPPYQQNDYVAWITRARRLETIDKRIGIMLCKLQAGYGYMGLPRKGR